MSVILMKQLLEAGVHFGHQTRKWNPKMAKYIFTSRNGIHVINLEQTVDLIDKAYAFIRDSVKEGKTILFVGTKKQAQDTIKEEAEKCGMFYVNNRWLGGTLTNFRIIRQRIDELNRLEQMEKSGEFALMPKKEVAGLKAEIEKLEKNMGGIKNMTKLPGVMFVVDSKKEYIAVREARSLGIPVVGLIDTNCDPDLLDVVIAGNDDAIRSIKLIVSAMSDAVIEAKEGEEGLAIFKQKEAEALKAQETAAAAEVKPEAAPVEAVKAEVKAEVKPEVKPVEVKPEVKADVKPVEAKVAPKAEVKPAKAEVKAEVKAEAKAEEKPAKKETKKAVKEVKDETVKAEKPAKAVKAKKTTTAKKETK